MASGNFGTAAAAQIGGTGVFLAAGNAEQIWQEVVQPAIKSAGLNAVELELADVERANWDVIRDASVVIADLTESSKELSFSAGVLRGIGKPLVVLSAEDQPLPVDVSIQRVLTYHKTPRGRVRLRQDLERALIAIIRTLNIAKTSTDSTPADVEDRLNQLLADRADPEQIAEIAEVAAHQAAISTDKRKARRFRSIAVSAWLAAGMLDEAEYSLRSELAGHPDDPSILAELGRVYSERGDIKKARSLYEEALSLSRPTSSLNGSILLNLGTLYALSGDFERAREMYERAAKILRDNGDSLGYATVLSNIGQLHYEAGELPQALEHLERAADIYQQHDSMQGLAEAQRSLVTILIASNQLEAARDMFQSALKLTEQLKDKRGLAYLQLQGASLALREGRIQEVRERSQRALKDFQRIGDRRGEGIARSLLGQALLHANEIDEAAEHLGIALDILRETDEPEARELEGLLRQLIGEGPASDA